MLFCSKESEVLDGEQANQLYQCDEYAEDDAVGEHNAPINQAAFAREFKCDVHAVEGDEGCGCGGDDEAGDPKGEDTEDKAKGC